ncbi:MULTISPECIES: ADP-ribose diphosphatase [Gallibacterium]|uniref:ADP-ribose pyrophosphatase n=1 Tax=Gallibacterium genomosp. 3 TaxID=505345 RepID=A0A1A7PR13_9PAST|nr:MULTISPECIES: ADP-ribose diphosphatase [Gallibacterium]MDA3977947.1 ADP-ribose diphosphatase [Gallibacterium sp. AGMB14963]OBX05013.1 ADP-ribose pyrophosphatase [Gallibacterium genomosp. 3]
MTKETVIRQYGQQDVEMLHDEVVFKGFYTMKRVQFRHRLFSGEMSGVVTREVLTKNEATAVVLYDPQRDNVVLVEQIRIGAIDATSSASPWLLELVAGMIETGEKPDEVAVRESEEEAGVQLTEILPIMQFWDSPGGMSERIHLFAGRVDSSKVGGIHGLAEENEDIRVHVVARETAYQWLEAGKIDNGVAVIGLQWLQLNYGKLQKIWQ